MGTIFKINTDGTSFAQLHSFVGGAADGQHPSFSALIVSGNTLYGMTPEGGTAGQGTIFRINTDGSSFAILHTFTAASGDGWDPDGSLVLSGNTLYGMTRQGGGGAGTIFQINTDGSGYSRLHTFLGASTGDGANPVGTLTALGSLLYGTTPVGGDTPWGPSLASTWTGPITVRFIRLLEAPTTGRILTTSLPRVPRCMA